jgi:hypothetical protein
VRERRVLAGVQRKSEWYGMKNEGQVSKALDETGERPRSIEVWTIYIAQAAADPEQKPRLRLRRGAVLPWKLTPRLSHQIRLLRYRGKLSSWSRLTECRLSRLGGPFSARLMEFS